MKKNKTLINSIAKICKLSGSLAIMLSLFYATNAQSETIIKEMDCYFKTPPNSKVPITVQEKLEKENFLIFSIRVNEIGHVTLRPNYDQKILADGKSMYGADIDGITTWEQAKEDLPVTNVKFSKYSSYAFNNNHSQFKASSEITPISIKFRAFSLTPSWGNETKKQIEGYGLHDVNMYDYTLIGFNSFRGFNSSGKEKEVQEVILQGGTGYTSRSMICYNQPLNFTNTVYNTLSQTGECSMKNPLPEDYTQPVISWKVYQDGSTWWKAGGFLKAPDEFFVNPANPDYHPMHFSQIYNPTYSDNDKKGLKTMTFKGYLPIKRDLGYSDKERPTLDEPRTWTVNLENNQVFLSRVKYTQKYKYELNCQINNYNKRQNAAEEKKTDSSTAFSSGTKDDSDADKSKGIELEH